MMCMGPDQIPVKIFYVRNTHRYSINLPLFLSLF